MSNGFILKRKIKGALFISIVIIMIVVATVILNYLKIVFKGESESGLEQFIGIAISILISAI